MWQSWINNSSSGWVADELSPEAKCEAIAREDWYRSRRKSRKLWTDRSDASDVALLRSSCQSRLCSPLIRFVQNCGPWDTTLSLNWQPFSCNLQNWWGILCLTGPLNPKLRSLPCFLVRKLDQGRLFAAASAEMTTFVHRHFAIVSNWFACSFPLCGVC